MNGKLTVKGDSGRRVVFRNSRFDEDFIEAPGQWDGIYLLEGSRDNEIEYAIIENNRYGFRVGTPDQDTIPDLVLKNTIIRHSSENAILSFTSDIYAENSLFYNSGGPVLLNVAGGNYFYDHCTIANSPNFFFIEDPAVIFSDNILLDNNERLVDELNVGLLNSIVYGSNEEELFVSLTEEVPYNIVINNNLISGNIEYPGNVNSVETNFPGFVNLFAFDYMIDSVSIAIDAANSQFLIDLDGRLRDENPDIGAYEFIKE